MHGDKLYALCVQKPMTNYLEFTMKLAYAIVALSALSTSVVFASGKKTPNCEVKGKKVSVKDAAACEKKHGTWMEAAATSAPEATHEAAPAAAHEAAPAEAAPAAK
jgi:hypothetical protein